MGNITGILGMLLIVGGYYLLWISPNIELNEVIIRTKIAIVMNFFGAIMVIYYLYRK